MQIKKIAAAFCAAVMCLSFAACSSSSDSSSKSSSVTSSVTSQAEASSVVGTTNYDVNGDTRCYETLRDKYQDDYTLTFTCEAADGSEAQYTLCVKDNKAYESSTVQGMKSYRLCLGDGQAYLVNEGTTTYNLFLETESTNYAKNTDMLFGATKDFDHAEIDTATNTVYEYYTLDSGISGSEGEIAFGFNGESYDLTAVNIVINGKTQVNKVSSIDKADENLLVLPDLSSYTRV